jgi:dTDP-4-dehydrorhamnose reductase
MRVVVLGGTGQVGSELLPALSTFAEVIAPARAAVRLEDRDGLRRFLDEARPDVVVNAAAWNDVDGAEGDEAGALAINRDAVALLGEAARAGGFGLIHYSTDFVFDGEKGAPYVEDDAVSPLGAYARSKVEGERALHAVDAPAIVLRTAWVYSVRAKSFVSAILAAARRREELRVVADQVGHPTFARDLAVATALLLRGVERAPFEAIRDARGVYHAAGGGATSRFELARAALALDPRASEHVVKRVLPVGSDEYPLPARRPREVILDGEKLRARFGLALPPWQDALRRALADLALHGTGG